MAAPYRPVPTGMSTAPQIQIPQAGNAAAADLPPMTAGERLVVAATPIVTLGALVGLGYPPFAALTRYRVAHNPKDSPKKVSYWQVLKGVKEKEGKRGLYKGKT